MPTHRARPPFPGRSALAVAAAVLWTVATLAPAAADSRLRAAVFDLELYDTSLEGEMRGENAAEQQRLAMLSARLRDRLAASARFQVVDTAPIRSDIAQIGHIRGCNGCDADLARKLGADVAITGVVQKVSNLILNINLAVRDAATGELTESHSADIRGNTDRSWQHGLDWLLRNRLLKDDGAGR